jgi:hypothetical protein
MKIIISKKTILDYGTKKLKLFSKVLQLLKSIWDIIKNFKNGFQNNMVNKRLPKEFFESIYNNI